MTDGPLSSLALSFESLTTIEIMNLDFPNQSKPLRWLLATFVIGWMIAAVAAYIVESTEHAHASNQHP